MKKLVLLGLLSLGSVALADDNLLQNGDFSSGISHWEGDCHTASSDEGGAPDFTSPPAPTTGTATAPTAAQGVFVKLRHEDWTKMTQDFDGDVGLYGLTVTYSLSADAKLSTKPDDFTNVPDATGLSRFGAFSIPPGRWVMIVCDLGAMHFNYWPITPPAAGATGPQTVTAQVRLNSDDTEKKAICLVFPPGDGIVTVTNVSMVKQP